MLHGLGLKVEFECFSSCLASVQVCGSVGAVSQKPTPVNKRVVPNTSAHPGNSSLLFLQASGFTVMTLSWTCARWMRSAALRPTSSSTRSEYLRTETGRYRTTPLCEPRCHLPSSPTTQRGDISTAPPIGLSLPSFFGHFVSGRLGLFSLFFY